MRGIRMWIAIAICGAYTGTVHAQVGLRMRLDEQGGVSEGTSVGQRCGTHSVVEPDFVHQINWAVNDRGGVDLGVGMIVRTPVGTLGTVNTCSGHRFGTGLGVGTGPGAGVELSAEPHGGIGVRASGGQRAFNWARVRHGLMGE